jgi:glycosyltransferase involved in cell wall biosynthesis
MPPTISTIVPTYRPEKYLEQTLRCLGDQICQPTEVIVVDDGSDTDVDLGGSRSPGLRLHRIPHLGIAGARNAGVSLSRGELVHICDHDDLVEPRFYATIVEEFESDPSLDVVHTALGFIDAEGRRLPGEFPHPSPRYLGRRNTVAPLVQENQLGSVATVFRREVHDELGGFRDLRFVQDWDFWIRAAAAGKRFGFVPEVLSWHRRHARQQSRPTVRDLILEEIVDMLQAQRLPPGAWLARRRALSRYGLELASFRHDRGDGTAGVHKAVALALPFKPRGAVRTLLRTYRRKETDGGTANQMSADVTDRPA